MAIRMEIELTSRRDDDTFTWRAAGAKEPRGVADVSLFPNDSAPGVQFRVEAEVELDGITIVSVLPAKSAKPRAVETLDLLSSEDQPLVTQQLAPKAHRDRDGRRGRKGDRKPRGGKDRGRKSADRPRPAAKPKLPPRPKPPRLKSGRAHRDAVVEQLPDEQKPVADEVIRGGLQAVRKAVAAQNEQLVAEGKPQIAEQRMVALAEEILVKVRVAEWRDRADAALEQADVVDLRDLRSVVTAADGAAKDDESRAVAAQLRDALARRLDAEHHAWVDEIIELLDDDRVVRALHLSSRPPKAGAPLPAPVAMRLVDAAGAAMTSDVAADRWGHILDALALSPVRRQVVPSSLPSSVTPELNSTIARHGTALPEIAEIFGIAPDTSARNPRRARRNNRTGARQGSDGDRSSEDADAPTAEATPADPAPADAESSAGS